MNESGFIEPRGPEIAAVEAEALRRLLATSPDVAIELDESLTVVAVRRGTGALASDLLEDLDGAQFEATLTVESLPKFTALVDGARAGDLPRWRQLNHIAPGGHDIPVTYAATGIPDGRILLLGRDKREIGLLQKRLVQAQMTIEQDYERIRQIESRYRVLFETSSDPLLILSADAGRIVDANSAAARLFEREAVDLINRLLANQLAPDTADTLAHLFEMVRARGGQRSALLSLRSGRQVQLDALLFRSVSDTLILGRLRTEAGPDGAAAVADDALAALWQHAGDAIVFTDGEGQILRANPAFEALVNAAMPDRLTGESLGAYLGRPTVDLDVMLQNAARGGRMANYSTTLRTEYGGLVPVEISTTALPHGSPPGFGFVIRDVTRLEASRQSAAAVSAEAVEHVIELVGSTPLKELVRSTTDVVEKLCIETAIRLTNNNRAAAAEMLGLSRQSLYVKLRRFGLVDKDE